MNLIMMFRKQNFSNALKQCTTVSMMLVAFVVSTNLHAQELFTNGDFETGATTGWTSSPAGTHVINDGSFDATCSGTSITRFAAPSPPIDGMSSLAYDPASSGEGQLLSEEIDVPEACAELRFSMDLEYESLVAINAGSQDLSVHVFDDNMTNLGSFYSLSGSGSAQAQVPAVTITEANFSAATGSGSALLNSLAGQSVSIAIQSVADDGCLMYQVDNLSLVCQDPLVADDFSVTDPCYCDNPLNLVTATGVYLFHDYLNVDASPGLTITLSQNDGNLVDAQLTPIPVGSVFDEVTPGFYQLEFYTASGYSADIEVSSGFGFVPFTAGGCTFESCNDECPTTPACNDNVQLSLDTSCEAVFVPSLILEGRDVECPFQVRIKDANDVVLGVSEPNGGSYSHPTIDGSYVGSRWKAEVFYVDDNDVEVSCWGWFTVEDKLPPTLTCAPDITVSCKDNVVVDTEELAILGLNENCESATIVILSDELDENECGPSGISALRVVEYTAVDASGLEADVCSYTISYERVLLADVNFPENYTGECSGDEPPGTDETGVPTVGGCDLSLSDNLCKFNISFADDTTSTCGSNFTILRKWVVLDWCSASHRQSYQTIEISDTQAPVITCPEEMTVDATAGCSGTYVFSPLDTLNQFELELLEDCSSVTLSAGYLTADDRDANAVDDVFNSMVSLGSNSFRATLDVGINWVRYVAKDACGNESECRTEVTVLDTDAPNAICDQYTVVSLADNGWGRLRGISLDDGSYDACGGPVSFEVRRPSTACGEEVENERDDTVFGPYVQFCCTEANETLQVELKVIDEGGLFSTCTVNVVVQDKFDNFSLGCPSPVVITADCNSSLASIKRRYGTPSPVNSCGPVATFFSTDDDSGLGDCGSGIISRTWTAVIGQDTTNSTCVQSIEIEKSSNLTFSSFNPPAANPVANCMNYMEDLGDGPSLRNENVCSDVGFTFEDSPFFNVEGYCVKVIRTWTAIDFCNHNAFTGEGIWEWTQTIKVSDTTGPVLDEESCPEDITVSAMAPDCEASISVPMPSAQDACTGNPIPASGFTWEIEGTSFEGVGNTATEVLSVGEYTLVWTATGVCGEGASSSCEATITIEDNTKPTPYCRSTVTTVITSANGQTPSADIWASDFDLGSEDDCGGDLTVSFSPTDLSDTQRIYECHELGFHSLEIYFTDESGNQDFCISTIQIQANGNVCDTIGQRTVLRVEGDIYTEDNEMVEDVTVGLEAMESNLMNIQSTDNSGHFAFENIEANEDYRLAAKAGNDYLNGVSTLDLVMIQRHILGLETLDSPYKLIAADVNNNDVINGLDLVELRKLILGIYLELPQNDSWKFVNEDQAFLDPTAPWTYKENIELAQLSQDMMDNDFIAVKIGDVNGSAIVNQSNPAGKPVNNGLSLETEIHALSVDNQYLIPVYFNQDAELYGLQMSLDLGADVKVVDVESGKIDMGNGHSLMKDGQLAVSYSEENLFSIAQEEALFYITVESSSKLTANVLELDSKQLNGEVYREGYQVEQLIVGEQLPSFVTKLYQNTPNPFSAETNIEFELPFASPVKLKIISLKGRVIKVIEGNYEQGRHTITLSPSDLTNDAVYYYQLETEDFTATRKMVRIR